MQANFVASGECQILTSASVSTFCMVLPVTSAASALPLSAAVPHCGTFRLVAVNTKVP